MSSPVWVLSVDLQTKTATFTSGLADAARSARGSFQSIRDDARSMGDGVSQGATNVRAGIGLIDNTIRGKHAAAMADLIREFQHTALVMNALPFAVTIGGIAAIAGIVVGVVAKYREWREEQEKLAADQTKLGTAANESFQALDTRLLQAEKRADELRNDHLGALRVELKLIDRESFGELVKQFDLVAKAADAVFADLTGHWYTFGIGSDGAKHALEQFKTQYDSLLAKGDEKGASDLLAGTKKSAEDVLKYQNQARSNQGTRTATGTTGDYSKVLQAENELKKAGVGYTDHEVKSQQALVDALNAQVTAQAKIAALAKAQGDNAKTATGNEAAARASEAARQAVSSQLAMAEQVLAGDKATAAARLQIIQASVAVRLQSELDFAARDRDVKLAANSADLSALNKTGADYANQVKANANKALEIAQQYDSQVAELKARASVEQNAKDIADLEAGERAKIEATQAGTLARLVAIDAGIKAGEAAALQESDFYRSLASERVQTIRQMALEESKLKAEAGKESADNVLKMAQLELAAQQEAQQLLDSGRRVQESQRIAEQVDAANRELAIKLAANLQEQGALDTQNKDYLNKLKALQDQESQLIRAHENQVTAIKEQAEAARNARVLSAEQRAEQQMAQGLTSLITRHQTFAQMVQQYSQEAAGSLVRLAIASIDANERTKMSDAAKAARDAFKGAMSAIPAPFNLVAAPLAGAAAFTTMMGFAGGTDMVPGVGRGDVVPAMLTPGEGVVPGGVMDGLRNVAKNGGFGQQPGMTVHVRPTYHLQALDGKGVGEVLEKHTGVLQKHFEGTLRKMNR